MSEVGKSWWFDAGAGMWSGDHCEAAGEASIDIGSGGYVEGE